MPFTVFSIGSGLLVLGFIFKVLQVTHRLTDIKSKETGKKLRKIGIISIVTGALIFLVAFLGMLANERNAMMVAGLNIAAIGVSILIQHNLKPQTERVLGVAAVVVIVSGFLLCLAYELFSIFPG
ncbi:hypothetical protein ACFLVS_04545 [Chloroflexota bacterium]